jgi:CRISPR-associated protein Csm1
MKDIKKMERQKIVLAALFHDIGKFWERCQESSVDSKIMTDEFPNKLYNHVVPVYDSGIPKYGHALWTQIFFNKYKIGQLLGLDDSSDFLANIAARHHKATNHLEAIVSLADKWSSSIDRPDENEEGVGGYNEVKEKWGSGFSKKVPLQSIFDHINISGVTEGCENSLRIKELDVMHENTIFPKEMKSEKVENMAKDYSMLWKAFEDEIEQLCNRCNSFDPFFISINSILKKYTWCMPSATNVIPANVSLYEHLKTTAGIALSLYDYYDYHNKKIEFSGGIMQPYLEDKDCLLMVCIDLSGIQKFIYDIANKRAAKSLKGRSFYLQVLMETIVGTVLENDDIQAYSTNVIYQSGGKAYLILPNTIKVKDALLKIDEEVQDYLWQNYNGRLYAAFGLMTFYYETLKDFKSDKWTYIIKSEDISDKERKVIGKTSEVTLDLGDLWRLVSERAAAKKQQKFKSKVLQYDNLFQPISYSEASHKCAVTGERVNKDDVTNIADEGEKEIWVSNAVQEQIEMGNALKKGQYLVTFPKELKWINHDIAILNNFHEIKSASDISKLPSNDKIIIKKFNEFQNTSSKSLKNVGYTTIFYGGNNQPKIEENLKSFEELAKTDNGQTTKLGVLRMDVDNLGQIFIKGFDDKIQKKSFAAYATLSSMLELFFCGHINYIQQSNDLFNDYVQILYSGGDDLFAVGRWDAIIEFAEEIRREFAKFVGRKDISISGGIAIVNAKYPISKAADISAEAEKSAKNFRKSSDEIENSKIEKNAICFFGEPISWHREFDFVKEVKDKFVLYDGIISRALLHQIQKYKKIKDTGKDNDKIDLSYQWHSAYSITRTLENISKDKNEDAWSFVNDMRVNILFNREFGNERYLDLIALAARWAEYIIKDKN